MKSQNTVFAIDLHGVIFKHNYTKMFKTFFICKKKLQLLRALLSPSLWLDSIKLKKKKGIAEQYLVRLADKHHKLKPFVPLGITIANHQKPQHDFIALLHTLKKNGYKLYLFSNIGSVIFKDIQKKFPDIFSLFENFTIPSKEDNYIRKPTNKSFDRFIFTNNLKNKNIIFIDDKQKNIDAAQQHNINGIFFRSTKQLCTELKNVGITLTQTVDI
ncbi:HAD hydrolase-like protein [bacterium]|nr:HAD hydrolase-like protein [bacterium]